MRTREEIEEGMKRVTEDMTPDKSSFMAHDAVTGAFTVELLLDIRELLEKKEEKNKTVRERYIEKLEKINNQ